MNSFLALSIDTYNKREQIICCIGYADEYFSGKSKNIITESRELGEFVFDFSENKDRQNILREYMSQYKQFVEVNSQRWQYDEDMIKKHTAFEKAFDVLKTPILTDCFFEKQKHLSLNDRHKLTSYELLKDKTTGEHLHYLYIGDCQYVAADFDFVGLLRYYLDELYGETLFPRSCMSCGKLFISGKKHGDALCSSECQKEKKSQNTMAYYGNLSENEVLYTKIYRKWKQHIDRTAESHSVSEKGLKHLREERSELTSINRIRANERKKGNIHGKYGVPDYELFDKLNYDMLMSKDKLLYTLFNSVKNAD